VRPSGGRGAPAGSADGGRGRRPQAVRRDVDACGGRGRRGGVEPLPGRQGDSRRPGRQRGRLGRTRLARAGRPVPHGGCCPALRAGRRSGRRCPGRRCPGRRRGGRCPGRRRGGRCPGRRRGGRCPARRCGGRCPARRCGGRCLARRCGGRGGRSAVGPRRFGRAAGVGRPCVDRHARGEGRCGWRGRREGGRSGEGEEGEHDHERKRASRALPAMAGARERGHAATIPTGECPCTSRHTGGSAIPLWTQVGTGRWQDGRSR
jgi:hypothetical protein